MALTFVLMICGMGTYLNVNVGLLENCFLLFPVMCRYGHKTHLGCEGGSSLFFLNLAEPKAL